MSTVEWIKTVAKQIEELFLTSDMRCKDSSRERRHSTGVCDYWRGRQRFGDRGIDVIGRHGKTTLRVYSQGLSSSHPTQTAQAQSRHGGFGSLRACVLDSGGVSKVGSRSLQSEWMGFLRAPGCLYPRLQLFSRASHIAISLLTSLLSISPRTARKSANTIPRGAVTPKVTGC